MPGAHQPGYFGPIGGGQAGNLVGPNAGIFTGGVPNPNLRPPAPGGGLGPFLPGGGLHPLGGPMQPGGGLGGLGPFHPQGGLGPLGPLGGGPLGPDGLPMWGRPEGTNDLFPDLPDDVNPFR